MSAFEIAQVVVGASIIAAALVIVGMFAHGHWVAKRLDGWQLANAAVVMGTFACMGAADIMAGLL